MLHGESSLYQKWYMIKILWLLTAALPVCVHAQMLSPEQRLKDSIAFEKFRSNYPEAFRNIRHVQKTTDGSRLIHGYSFNLRLQNDSPEDSAYYNFHPGMPDTSTLTPYAAIRVHGEKVSIGLLGIGPMGGPNSSEISLIPVKEVPPGEIIMGDSSALEISTKQNPIWVRLSVNGKPLADWQPLNNYRKEVYKELTKYVTNLAGKKDSFNMYTYGYIYSINTINLGINDQLLVEIKDTKRNWMLDRFNITRAAGKPILSMLVVDQAKNNQQPAYIEKVLSVKDSIFREINSAKSVWPEGSGLPMNNVHYSPYSRLALFFRKPGKEYPDSTLEYRLTGSAAADTNWHRTGHLILIDRQEPNAEYTLWVRYISAPMEMATYHFFIPPRWDQTTAFKIIAGTGSLLALVATFLLIHSVCLK